MINLRDVSTEELLKEIITRQGIRSIEVSEEEFHKTKNSKDEKGLKTVKGIKWTKEDKKYLENNYKNFTIEELALELNRTENSIRSKIQVIKKKIKEN